MRSHTFAKFMRVVPVAALFLCLISCPALAADAADENESPQAGQNPAPLPPQTNVQLPRWLMLRAEHRGRIEGFTSGGFVSNRDDAYWLNRFRVNARIAPRPGVAFHLQVQDARVYGKNTGAGGPPFRGLRVFGEYNYASGDGNPADGTRETFDQLYPTGHDKLGLADQVGWRNVHHLRSGVELKPHPKWLLSGSYHSWWLAAGRDAMYNAGGGVLARIPAGAPDRHIGQELDVQATFSPAVALQIAAGYAHLFPGAFLQAATPGKTYGSPFVMVTSVLTMERK